MKTFKYYNKTTRLLVCAGIVPVFLFVTILFWISGNGFLLLMSVFTLLAVGILLYKALAIELRFTREGVMYKSPLKQKYIEKSAIHSVLLILKNRRSEAEYISYPQWRQLDVQGGNAYVMIRTKDKLPPQGSFMFSAPVEDYYIVIQYRKELEHYIECYLETQSACFSK